VERQSLHNESEWKQKDIAQKQKDISLAYKRFFNTDDGKKVLMDIASKCFASRTTFVQGSPDRSHFNEGMRSVYLHIVKSAYNSQTQEGEHENA